MEKGNWTLKLEGNEKNVTTYATSDQCINDALYLIAQRIGDTNVIVNNALKHRHTKIVKTIIEGFRDLTQLRNLSLFDLFYDYSEKYDCPDNCIVEDGFRAEWNGHESIIFSIILGDDLYIETNLWDMDETTYYFIFARTKTDSVKYSIRRKLSDTANMYLVYKQLTSTPQSRADIRSGILCSYGPEGDGYDVDLSEDTISNHIHGLQDLGVPVYISRLSPKDKWMKESLESTPVEGFYLDKSNSSPPDYSKIKPRSYLMLVYFTLKDVDRGHALKTQQAVIDAVYDRFGVKLQRQKVKKYLNILIELCSGVKCDKDGYWGINSDDDSP